MQSRVLIHFGSIIQFAQRERSLRARWPMASSFFTVQPGETGKLGEDTVNEDTLQSAPIPAGRLHEFNARGRTLRSGLHPLQPQGQSWISEKQINARSQSSFIVCAFFEPVSNCVRVPVHHCSPRNSFCIHSTFPTSNSQKQGPR